jgi:NAD(P)-dependent dehydrogenase (short-subunit alcohol dehydrogenase family)
MKSCLIVGTGSDIARELAIRLKRDEWTVTGVPARTWSLPVVPWDLLILAHGQLSPIGKFFDTPRYEWGACVAVNGLAPLEVLRTVWMQRNPDATVIFMAGPNMKNPSATYSAYRAGKAIIEALLPTLAEEYPDVRFRILRPGVVKTKIHDQTLQAGHKAANYIRVFGIVNGTEPTISHDEVYRRLKALHERDIQTTA